MARMLFKGRDNPEQFILVGRIRKHPIDPHGEYGEGAGLVKEYVVYCAHLFQRCRTPQNDPLIAGTTDCQLQSERGG